MEEKLPGKAGGRGLSNHLQTSARQARTRECPGHHKNSINVFKQAFHHFLKREKGYKTMQDTSGVRVAPSPMWIVRKLGEDHSCLAPLPSKAKVVELSTEGLLVAAEKVTVSCAAELEKATSRGSGVRVDSTTTLKRAKFPTAPRMTEALRR